ncbi:MAG: alanyl-tRNA editing protein [Candidatus Altiarchaeota archaeon]
MLYEQDPYLREFDSKVKSVTDGKYVVLEDTCFYPNSGGQPHDTGVLVKDGVEYRVVFAKKFGGEVSHEIDPQGLAVGASVHGVIDWERRYILMRSHTAAHMLSAVINQETGADISGNQLDLEYSRIDFNLEDFDRERVKDFERLVNEAISRDMHVKVRQIPREEALKDTSLFRLLKGFPEGVQVVNVVEVEGFDMQACGGTHVRNTKEIGPLEVFKAENKGKNNRRMYFRLRKL